MIIKYNEYIKEGNNKLYEVESVVNKYGLKIGSRVVYVGSGYPYSPKDIKPPKGKKFIGTIIGLSERTISQHFTDTNVYNDSIYVEFDENIGSGKYKKTQDYIGNVGKDGHCCHVNPWDLRPYAKSIKSSIDPYGEEDWDENEGIKWYKKGKFEESDEGSSEDIEKYDDFITNDEFRDFLIDNGFYDKYIEKASRGDFFMNFDKYEPEQYIIGAFGWWDQAFPHTRWDEIHDKWIKYLRNNDN